MSGGTFLPSADENGPDEAERSESKRHHRTLFAFYLAAQLLGFGVAVLALHNGQGWALAPALIALFPLAHAGGVARRDDRLATTQQLRVFLAALLTALAASLVLWSVLSALDANVTKSAQLPNADGLESRETVELRVDEEPGFFHDELLVTLTVTDDKGGQSPCISVGELEFTGEDLAKSVPGVDMDTKVSATLPLKDTGPSVSVDVRVVTDSGCRLTLQLDEAGYR